jgi:endonuclease/exonuclease/phosphatase family metal-dependent hydrolase
MRIVSWNMNYWQNTHILNTKKDKFISPSFKNNSEEVDIWKKKCKEFIIRLNPEIMLLQEINPFALYGINYELNNKNQYIFAKEDKTIIYHELYNELLDENLNNNYWGNAIIISNNLISYKRNNITLDNNNYYGRYGLMIYDFTTKNETNLTIINYYNKKNRNKNIYSMPYDIRNILEFITKEKCENTIIFAGDFNSDKERDSSNRKFFNFIEGIGFENLTIGEIFINTMVPKARPYPNDKVFIKNKQKVKTIICDILKDTDIHLSDHYPILCEIIEK